MLGGYRRRECVSVEISKVVTRGAGETGWKR